MALDNETKSPSVEAEENKTKPVDVEVKKTDEEEKPTDVDVEDVKIENEAVVEKINDQKVIEKKEIAEAVAEIIEKNGDELVEKEAVPKADQNKQDEPRVIEENKEADPVVSEEQPVPNVIDEKKEDEPIVPEKQLVPADEIAMKKMVETKENEEENSKDGCINETFEPINLGEPASDVKKDDEAAENAKQDTMETSKTKENTMEAIETKENEGTDETAVTTTETKDTEKSEMEAVKTETKEEKTMDEIKLADSKEEVKTSPRQSNSLSLMGKVKKSFMKAKKAISGKNNSNTKNPETKEDQKA